MVILHEFVKGGHGHIIRVLLMRIQLVRYQRSRSETARGPSVNVRVWQTLFVLGRVCFNSIFSNKLSDMQCCDGIIMGAVPILR